MKDNDTQAFPSKEIDYEESAAQGKTVYHDQDRGMTLRDYFAAKTLNGIMSSSDMFEGMRRDAKIQDNEVTAEEHISLACYQLADAMLKARNQ